MSNQSKNLWQNITPFSEKHNTASLHAVTTADIVVVGGGYTGLSSAYHLAKAGLDVVVLEANDIGHGGSGRNVGLSNSGLWIMPSMVVSELGHYKGRKLNQTLIDAPNYVAQLINENDIDCDFKQNGTLHLAHKKSARDYLKERSKQLNSYGAKTELISKEEAFERTGAKGYHGALMDPSAGIIHPLKYCHGLGEIALKAGVEIYTDSAVTDIFSQGRSYIVSTEKGRVIADKVILATNAYEEVLSYNEEYYTPLYYCQLATRPLTAFEKEKCLPSEQGTWDSGAVMRSFRLDEHDRLLVGTVGDIHHPEAKYFKMWSKHVLKKTFPHLANIEYEFEWSGRIGKSHNNIPQVRQFDRNIFQVMGYSGRGIAPATAVGRAFGEFFGQRKDMNQFPIPFNEARKIDFNDLRAKIYETGCQLSRLSDAILR